MTKIRKTIWTRIRDAISGKEQDLTNISLKKALLVLAVPMVFEMLMESLFAVVDIYYVGKLGTDAVATVGFTESVLTIVYSLGFGISMAATALVARRVGEKNIEMANVSAVHALYLGAVLAVVISFFGIFFPEEILRMMKADENVVATGKEFTRWMIGGNFVILFLFLLNGVFRGAGNANIAMIVLIVSNGLNIILDPILIHGIGDFEGYGLVGAAYATNMGRAVGIVLQLFFLFRGVGVLKVRLKHFILKAKLLLKVLNISAGGFGQFIIASASWIFLMRIMSEFGSEAVAGYTTAIRVIVFTILPAWGLANAAATLVGQNLGAKSPDRAEESVWMTSKYSSIFLGLVSVIYFLFAEPIIGIFTDNQNVLANGVQCLKYLSISYVFFAMGMVISQAFNGAGDTRTPTILNFFAFWIIQIPLAYLLAIAFDLKQIGVYLAIMIAETLLSIAAIIIFRRGKWKNTEI